MLWTFRSQQIVSSPGSAFSSLEGRCATTTDNAFLPGRDEFEFDSARAAYYKSYHVYHVREETAEMLHALCAKSSRVLIDIHRTILVLRLHRSVKHGRLLKEAVKEALRAETIVAIWRPTLFA